MTSLFAMNFRDEEAAVDTTISDADFRDLFEALPGLPGT
jgi:hypothetical protein